MSEPEPIPMEVLARKVRQGIVASHRAVCIGNAPRITEEYLERMSNPQVGDLVAETTTSMMRTMPDIDAVGVLEEVTREPVDFGDPDFVWDEEYEGKPHPTERVTYIRTFDGRLFRWINAHFVAAVSD